MSYNLYNSLNKLYVSMLIDIFCMFGVLISQNCVLQCIVCFYIVEKWIFYIYNMYSNIDVNISFNCYKLKKDVVFWV